MVSTRVLRKLRTSTKKRKFSLYLLPDQRNPSLTLPPQPQRRRPSSRPSPLGRPLQLRAARRAIACRPLGLPRHEPGLDAAVSGREYRLGGLWA